MAWGFAGDREEQLEFWGELILGVEAVGEVNSADAAVGVDLHSKWSVTGLKYLPQGLNVVGSVGTSGEVGQVELNLIPTLVQSHGHGADEGLDTGGGLVVTGSKSATHVLVIKDLHLEGKVLLQL